MITEHEDDKYMRMLIRNGLSEFKAKNFIKDINIICKVYGLSLQQKRHLEIALLQSIMKSFLTKEEIIRQISNTVPGFYMMLAEFLDINVEKLGTYLNGCYLNSTTVLPDFLTYLSSNKLRKSFEDTFSPSVKKVVLDDFLKQED